MGAPYRLTDQEVELQVQRLDARGLGEELRAICLEHHVTLEDVLSKAGSRSRVRAREACCAALSAHGLSSNEIGFLLAMDHTTVLYAIRRFKGRNGPP